MNLNLVFSSLLYKLQGTSDGFLANQLKPEAFKSAAAAAGYAPVSVRMQAGYDHSYYFISTFMADHIRYMILKTYIYDRRLSFSFAKTQIKGHTVVSYQIESFSTK